MAAHIGHQDVLSPNSLQQAGAIAAHKYADHGGVQHYDGFFIHKKPGHKGHMPQSTADVMGPDEKAVHKAWSRVTRGNTIKNQGKPE